MVSSIIWTDEEAKYLKAVLAWDPAKGDAKKRSKPREKKTIKSEFRILVAGAKGTGKTSIMQRFCKNTFPSTPDPFYERGGRHTVEIDNDFYQMGALEMASKHLSSDAFLSQALAITEAAVLVYDVTSPDSFKLAQGVYDFLRDNKGNREYGILLVGNKNDVKDDERQVSWDEGRKAAMGFGSLLQAAGGTFGRDITGFAGHNGGYGYETKRATSPRLGSDGMAVGFGMGGVMGSISGDNTNALFEKKPRSMSMTSSGGRRIASRGSRQTASSRGGHGGHAGQTVSGKLNNMAEKAVVVEERKNVPLPELAAVERVDSKAETTDSKTDGPADEKAAEEGDSKGGIETAQAEAPPAADGEETKADAAAGSPAEKYDVLPVPAPPSHAPPPPPLNLNHSNGSTAASSTLRPSYPSAVSPTSATASQAVPSPRPATVSFMECSAKTGENINAIFEHTGREIMRLRKINQERKEEAERIAREMAERGGFAHGSLRQGQGKRGIWKTLTTPWFKRQEIGV